MEKAFQISELRATLILENITKIPPEGFFKWPWLKAAAYL